MKKTKVFSSIAFCRKAKTKVETSSLRNVKITRLFSESSRKWYFHEFHLCASSGSLSYRRIWHSLNGFGEGGEGEAETSCRVQHIKPTWL
jgi:hypothetical protein